MCNNPARRGALSSENQRELGGSIPASRRCLATRVDGGSRTVNATAASLPRRRRRRRAATPDALMNENRAAAPPCAATSQTPPSTPSPRRPSLPPPQRFTTVHSKNAVTPLKILYFFLERTVLLQDNSIAVRVFFFVYSFEWYDGGVSKR